MADSQQRAAVSGVVPSRPQLAPWYRLVEDGERLLLEFGQSVVALEGAAVRTLLPALLPLLDGTRTVAALVDGLGVAVRPAIESALETLAQNGLLTEGPAAPSWLRATADAFAAAYDASPSVVAERLASAVVAVVGASHAGAELARLLQAAGVGDVRRLSWRDGDAVDLAVVLPAPAEVALLASWNRVALVDGCPWLPVRPFDGRFAGVGPLLVPGESCCYECLLLRRQANLAFGSDLAAIEEIPVAATSDPAFDSLVTAFTAHLVLRSVAGQDRTLPGVLYAIESQPAPAITEHAVLRVPRCPACSTVESVAAPLPWHGAEAA